MDAAGKELYTVTDSGAVAEIDALINKAGGENADHGNAEETPLHLCLLAGDYPPRWEDPDAEREYLESSGPRCGRAATPSPRRSCPIPWRALGAL
ncbi:MAG: hypothetical protein ACLTYN_09990 [Dysosmobacter welbionis]